MAASTSYYYYLTTTATTADDRNVGINGVPMRMRLVTGTSINHRNKSSRHRLKLQTVATASSAGGEGEEEGGRSSPVHQLLFSVTPPNNSEIDYLGQSTKGDLNINFGPYLPPSPFFLTSLPLLLYVVHSFFFSYYTSQVLGFVLQELTVRPPSNT